MSLYGTDVYCQSIAENVAYFPVIIGYIDILPPYFHITIVSNYAGLERHHEDVMNI